MHYAWLGSFQYDTAAQGDGLHMSGPPMKYAINRMFHHMCAGVVEGSIA